jgi:hypothetical protein
VGILYHADAIPPRQAHHLLHHRSTTTCTIDHHRPTSTTTHHTRAASTTSTTTITGTTSQHHEPGKLVPAWYIDQGFLFFDRHFYIPATSPLLPDLLEALLVGGPAHMRFLALGSHPPSTAPGHSAAPSSILLGRPWPQCTVLSTTVIFMDGLGHQLFRIDHIYIGLRPNSNLPQLSPDELKRGDFMFGTMLDLTITSPTCSTSTIWCQVPPVQHRQQGP